MDFKKAFDSVSHNKLLYKLKMMDITGPLPKWFEAYLSGRQQCVAIGNHISDMLPVSSGVPQGSTLGPLLFLIYVNDISSEVNFSHIFLFADDTKCCKDIVGDSDCLLLQKDLNALSTWSSDWNLQFNETKCSLLSFHRKNLPPTSETYRLNNKPIMPVSSHKDLGIILTSDLSWNEQHSHI